MTTKKKAPAGTEANVKQLRENYTPHHTDAQQWLAAFDARLRSRQGVTRDEMKQAQQLRQALRDAGVSDE